MIARIALALVPFVLGAQEIVEPRLGWIFDSQVADLRPVRGVPGAATLGEPAGFGLQLRAACVSPDGLYAVGLDPEGVMLLRIPDLSIERIESGLTNPERVILSPQGRAAIVAASDSAAVITGLPDAPQVTRRIELRQGVELAVSDEGTAAVLEKDTGAITTFLPESEQPLTVQPIDGPRRIVFAPGVPDLAIAGDGGVALIREGAATIFEAPNSTAVRFSADGKTLITAGEGAIRLHSIESRETTVLEFALDITSFEPLGNGNVYRVDEQANGPVWVLAAEANPPRAVFIPRAAVDEKPLARARGSEGGQ